jgi:chromosome condensin MukBEF ATPase and DNA-binding subunit MukB
MNPLEIAKEIFGIAANAGLKKDVIDLFEKKVGLLTEEIAALNRKLEISETENANLTRKVVDLEQQLDRIQPRRGKLKEGAERILKLLFDNGDVVSVREMSGRLGMQEGVVKHHCDVLYEADMITFSSLDEWYIIAKGRAYVVDNGLVG